MATHLQPRIGETERPEPLVMSESAEGWKVYSTGDPKSVYLVTGTQTDPACTCPEYTSDPQRHCRHIAAALAQLPPGNPNGHDPYEAEERRAIQAEAGGPSETLPSSGSASTMTLKRSVSPDGRIDSLSVEFACSLADLASRGVQATAAHLLGVQSAIVEGFLREKKQTTTPNGNGASARRGNGQAPQAHPASVASGPLPARLVNVGGMDGNWGRRLFINVEVNGRRQRLFGKADELIAHISAAGYHPPEPFVEGAVLNIPCRVTTKPSPDGQYQNVDRVLPAESQARPRQ